MQYIIRYFSELSLKSKPVRSRMMRQLQHNLERRLRPLGFPFAMQRRWDKLTLRADAGGQRRDALVEILLHTPGIARFAEVEEYTLGGMEDILEKTLAVFSGQLDGRSFAVRCRRRGTHSFRSGDVERHVGEGLLRASPGARVQLEQPERTVHLEIDGRRLFVVRESWPGLCGFPLGTLDPVLSLASGGFDSTVASYFALKRGMPVHFCFFRLGGSAHETAVQEIALLLWERLVAPAPLQFIVVPFEEVVAEILRQVAAPYMGLVLKRAMLRAAGQVAGEMQIGTLLTGDSVSQVSSQTLGNLEVCDRATERLVLRPLATVNKEEIIRVCRQLGVEALCARVPEHCGVLSIRPRTRSREEQVLAQEARCDAEIFADALRRRRCLALDSLRELHAERAVQEAREEEAEILSAPLAGSTIIDVRHPAETDQHPLRIGKRVPVLEIPFYELSARFADLSEDTLYLLYCDRGIVSRIHAAQLRSRGHTNVKVYRPAPR